MLQPYRSTTTGVPQTSVGETMYCAFAGGANSGTKGGNAGKTVSSMNQGSFLTNKLISGNGNFGFRSAITLRPRSSVKASGGHANTLILYSLLCNSEAWAPDQAGAPLYLRRPSHQADSSRRA